MRNLRLVLQRIFVVLLLCVPLRTLRFSSFLFSNAPVNGH